MLGHKNSHDGRASAVGKRVEAQFLSVLQPKPLKYCDCPKRQWKVNETFPSIKTPRHLLQTNRSHGPVAKKPRFLEQLENFLRRELRHLNALDGKPSELRLQAHRQVFESMIEHFRTYRPLLAAIKNEYEMMLDYHKRRIRELQPLQEAIFTRKEQHQKQLMDFKQEERRVIADLKKESRRNLNELSEANIEKLDLEKQVERLKEQVEEENRKFRENNDRRMLLLAEISSLRFVPELYF
ncbi:translin-associated factor X-interacting protein 1-like [Gigantopelta aegis]|uniref:translin-associated factor X-interacting protein 1-like n=1 Tax=Gigantopelta aegis TaxID=1735272 RepID=UPI001B88C3DA|nr:translin-associated factor X-interacting protein 1-like [Gigantopelta aegis]